MMFMLPKGAEFCTYYFLDNTSHKEITANSCAGNEAKLMDCMIAHPYYRCHFYHPIQRVRVRIVAGVACSKWMPITHY